MQIAETIRIAMLRNHLRQRDRIRVHRLERPGFGRAQHEHDDDRHRDELEQRLGEFDEALRSEQPAPAADRRDSRQLRLDALQHQARRILQQRCGEAEHRQGDDQRHQESQRLEAHHREQVARVRAVAEREAFGIVEQALQRRRQLLYALADQERLDHHQRGHRGEDRSLPRDRDFALFERIADFLLGRLFCLALLIGCFCHARSAVSGRPARPPARG
ncbi:hypothetical protein ACVWZ3_006751 [Bradyrhizobium sp. i1.3.6]